MLGRLLIFSLVLCVFGFGAQAAHVQSYGNTGTSSGTAVTFPSFTAVGTGDCVVGNLEFHNSSDIISNIQVGSTSSTLLDYDFNAGTVYSAKTFALCGITGGPTTITVNFSSTPNGTDHYLVFDEYSHQLAVDGHQLIDGNSSSNTISPTITTAVNGDTIWTFLNPSTTPTTPSGYTARESDGTNHQYSADKSQTTAGSVSATWNWTSVGAVVYSGIIGLTPSPCVPGSLASLGVGAC